MFTDEFKSEFKKVKLIGQRCSVSAEEKRNADIKTIEFIRSALSGGFSLDDEDIACCLWNISDSFAMLRDCPQLYKNHCEFARHTEKMGGKYLFWTVCDATQKFTLTLGGYGGFWFELYRRANDENKIITPENEYIAYEAHRAAMAVHPQLDIPTGDIEYAARQFSDFISRTADSPQHDFYRTIYISASVKAFGSTPCELENLCEKLSAGLSASDKSQDGSIIGEWNSLNRPRSERNRAVVGITAAVNALIDSGNKKTAAEMYAKYKAQGLPSNAYIERRI